MDLGLSDKVAMVTGGSRGLGRHAALALAREGCNVAICARGQEALDRTVAELEALGIKVLGVQADVTSQEDAHRLFRATVDALGPVDVMVNNVGGSRGPVFDSADDAAWEYTLQLNLFSAIRLSRLVLPAMKEKGWGRIINIASIWGREQGGNLTYMAAKAALIAFSKHLAIEVAGTGVTVNTVAPGSIAFPGGNWQRFQDTNPPEVVRDFVKNNLPMGRFGWPEPVGALVAFLASAQADLMTGTCINIDGGQSKSLI
ncbi:MAG: SDR family oxidoreductase [Dehalococcoidia bacterium]|nr:SDR family oxidoreductase [Dehalococcoidia bacterium]